MFPPLLDFKEETLGDLKNQKVFGYRHILGYRHLPNLAKQKRNVPKQDANLCRCDFNLRLLASRLWFKNFKGL